MLLLHWGSKSLNFPLFRPGSCRLANSRSVCVSLMFFWSVSQISVCFSISVLPLWKECVWDDAWVWACATCQVCAFQALCAPVCTGSCTVIFQSCGCLPYVSFLPPRWTSLFNIARPLLWSAPVVCTGTNLRVTFLGMWRQSRTGCSSLRPWLSSWWVCPGAVLGLQSWKSEILVPWQL